MARLFGWQICVDEPVGWPVQELLKEGFATAPFMLKTVCADLEWEYKNWILDTLLSEANREWPKWYEAYGAWVGSMRAHGLFWTASFKCASKKSNSCGAFSKQENCALGFSQIWTTRWANHLLPMNSGCEEQRFSLKKVWGKRRSHQLLGFPYWFAEILGIQLGKRNTQLISNLLPAWLLIERSILFKCQRRTNGRSKRWILRHQTREVELYLEIYGKKNQFPENVWTISSTKSSESVGYPVFVREAQPNLRKIGLIV